MAITCTYTESPSTFPWLQIALAYGAAGTVNVIDGGNKTYCAGFDYTVHYAGDALIVTILYEVLVPDGRHYTISDTSENDWTCIGDVDYTDDGGFLWGMQVFTCIAKVAGAISVSTTAPIDALQQYCNIEELSASDDSGQIPLTFLGSVSGSGYTGIPSLDLDVTDPQFVLSIGAVIPYLGTDSLSLTHAAPFTTNLFSGANGANLWYVVGESQLLTYIPPVGIVIDSTFPIFDRTTYANLQTRRIPFLVMEKVPQNRQTYKITAVNYDPNYYDPHDDDFTNGIIVYNGGDESGGGGDGGTGDGNYRPSIYNDLGDLFTTNPEQAYDTIADTFANASGTYSPGDGQQPDYVQYLGFPNLVLHADSTINIDLEFEIHIAGHVHIASTGLFDITWNSDHTRATISYTVPAGTNISTIGIGIWCAGDPHGGTDHTWAICKIYDIWIVKV